MMPEDWTVAVVGLNRRRIEPAGIVYECRLIRDRITLGYDVGKAINQQTLAIVIATRNNGAKNESTIDEVERPDEWIDTDDAVYEKYLRDLDPNDCKSQDHYKVLGLSRLRWMATSGQIRTAYRLKVLKHHPDKRQHRGVTITKKNESEDYFTCITKAYEQLGGTEQKRRAYDSVDPLFDDSIPSGDTVSADTFFNVFGPVFERNQRWSNNWPVPDIGDANSDRQHVEQFYSFWFDFSSWREFSYLDEEDKEKGEDRWERREIEKMNRVERDKRRKKEVKRIRNMVEYAYSCDPRIARFKQADKDDKEEQKRQRIEAMQQKRDAALKERMDAEEAERAAIEAQEAIDRERRIEERKLKEAQKKEINRERRRLKRIAEESNYWTTVDDAKEKIRQMEQISKISNIFSIENLRQLNDVIEANITNYSHIRSHIEQCIVDVETQRLQISNDEQQQRISNAKAAMNGGDCGNNGISSTVTSWSADENQLLIKAVTIFPPGSQVRWQSIANYINTHRKQASTKPKSDRDVIKQVKAIQQMESNSKEMITSGGKGQHKLAADITIGNGENVTTDALPNTNVWSSEEQKLLEQALRTYPATMGSDRWDRIAECLPNKSKKECIRRFKELVDLVRERKAAQATVK